MSQHDYIISNDTGANVRSDLNNALGAIATINSGATEPSTTYAYQLWMDTSSNVLKIRNSANSAWYTLPISPVANNTVDINGGTIDGASVAATSLSSTGTTALQNLSTTNSALNISSSASDGSATIDASGNLLVGKTAQDTDIAGMQFRPDIDVLGVTRDGGQPLFLNRLTSDGDIAIFAKDGTTVGSIKSVSGVTTAIDGGSTYAGLQFKSTTLTPRKSGASSNGGVSLGESSYPFNDLYLSGGVYLGGTGSANYLDDYEEGTWTPGASVGGVGSSSGNYVKIGSVVYFWGYISSFTNYVNNESQFVTGLPFSRDGNQAAGSAMWQYTDSNDQWATVFVSTANGIAFYRSSETVNYDPMRCIEMTANSSVYFQGQYRTTS